MIEIPIHVMIPSYNNAIGLSKLLPSLLKQNFASITVLDDASSDNTSELLKTISSVIHVRSEMNIGTVGANNLSLQALPKRGWILFLDSDMEVVTDDMPSILNNFIAQHPKAGVGVGKIITRSGERLRWNFNYDLNPWRGVCAFLTYYPARLLHRVPFLHIAFKQLSLLFVAHMSADVAQKVDWGIEANFFISVSLWTELNGFDSRFKRFHEGPDLFLRARKCGYEAWYVPKIVARDTDQGTGSTWERRYHWWRSLCIYYYKHPSRLFIYRYPRP